ncbi:MAG: hypothetical protein QW057_09135 [Candidatus Bathyarchaeia archaeon]
MFYPHKLPTLYRDESRVGGVMWEGSFRGVGSAGFSAGGWKVVLWSHLGVRRGAFYRWWGRLPPRRMERLDAYG